MTHWINNPVRIERSMTETRVTVDSILGPISVPAFEIDLKTRLVLDALLREGQIKFRYETDCLSMTFVASQFDANGKHPSADLEVNWSFAFNMIQDDPGRLSAVNLIGAEKIKADLARSLRVWSVVRKLSEVPVQTITFR